MTQNIPTLVYQLFFTMVGGSIACAAGFWLTFYKRKRDARDTFGVFISVVRGRIDTRNVAEFYLGTKGEIRDAVSRVQPFLSEKNALAMEDLWRDYAAIVPEQRLNQKYEDYEWERGLHKAVPTNEPQPPPKPSDILREYYKKFSELTG